MLSESSKDNTQSPNQTRYQLTSHLQSNTLELDDKAESLVSGQIGTAFSFKQR
jgi:insecticidal toxin complex protein TccC